MTPSIEGVGPAPFASNVIESGSGFSPTFTLSYPTTVDGVTVLIYEKNIRINPSTGLLETGGSDLVYAHGLPGATNSYILPTVLHGGFMLTPGTNYVVALKAQILFNLTLPLDLSNANTAAQSVSYFDFTPQPGTIQPPIILPTIDSNGAYHFNLTVQPNTTYYIDPTVATGFIYTIGTGDPNFATVVLPTLQGSEPYTITWDKGLDGILTAEDVSTLDLKGTWLVTLSACDTGSGEARAGEGVMGLRRGFIEAGAQNLLMTLWPISDEVTVQIMSDFYEAAHKTGNAPEALAEVQRDWLVQLRDGKGPKFDKVKDAINGRGGLAKAVNLAGALIMSSQGKP